MTGKEVEKRRTVRNGTGIRARAKNNGYAMVDVGNLHGGEKKKRKKQDDN
jgi:hypothetical protein